ncbi:hypothetical protein JMM81_15090 [Bacillus sp. V3B]|uniref:CBO0543 family protein n=1 Tax=Bacillus sp. V3B TaxID=2804915 RepID=UPI00210967FB|nr:CBO0543 family protein [Bacillus sp. V3B]MCQ6276251.1 hypothetical protein [Bacillus sp. V3B]
MNNKTEKIIETSSWVVMSILLIKFVPRNRIREALVIFSFKQALTWFFGLLVVERNLISYPYRMFFKKAVRSSFTFEFFIYPAICVLFNLYYPDKKSKLFKFLYYCLFSSIITFFEMIALKYTRLIKYKNWTWYLTFSTLWTFNYLSRVYHQWYFKEGSDS